MDTPKAQVDPPVRLLLHITGLSYEEKRLWKKSFKLNLIRLTLILMLQVIRYDLDRHAKKSEKKNCYICWYYYTWKITEWFLFTWTLCYISLHGKKNQQLTMEHTRMCICGCFIFVYSLVIGVEWIGSY